ncbi:Crp/Fnr family transcriptional regulator [Rivibacter subsaxonicus]|uniref:CRP-like cAMP-binding protein n=1 Tax=Rivibacter subsaxonicus TaxID=457575 RepID=A0A4Q7W2X5_9BURK|nr:Crp/Fnr family transcriptional regulator [Rivibacter subsaxonicus]RZU03129.1 CRP-like cAMP-binding protein [Rivibacter subsaxonicus]
MPDVENKLIELLPRKDRLQLLAICEPVQLALSEVLCEPDRPTRHVYFPTSGFISLLSLMNGQPALEVGMVGREGMLGVQLVLGVASAPLHAVVQGPGAAWRIASSAFRTELARSAALQRGLDRYLYVLMRQLATSAACLRFHLTGPRLARWLLMSQDRAGADSFHVTHEFLAYMLGVRRVGITTAAVALQRAGLIEYRRGWLTVRDRSGLEAAACSCYGVDRQAYAELLGRPPARRRLTAARADGR